MKFDDFKLHNKEPVYTQIVSYIKHMVLTGELQDGDVLPSRRELAILLNINPNTSQKAYKLMEEEGIIVTPNNLPSRIVVSDNIRQELERELKDDMVREFLVQVKKSQMTLEDTMYLIKQYWEEV